LPHPKAAPPPLISSPLFLLPYGSWQAGTGTHALMQLLHHRRCPQGAQHRGKPVGYHGNGLTEPARLLKPIGNRPLTVLRNRAFRLTARYGRFIGPVSLNLKIAIVAVF
jgi:hypothetical protein